MPGKILVAYTSKHGATQRYAEWIAEALHADLVQAQKVKPETLMQYDLVIYGGGLYAGGIAGTKLVTKNPCKKLVVFTVGLADPNATDYTAIINRNFAPALRAKTRFFHLRGGMDYKALSVAHRIMMSMMKGMVEKKPEAERSAEDNAFLASYNGKVNFADQQTINPIIAYATSI
ncbi:MAG: flavodoxin domain-containing protein [Oscillospiraceae bacterium]